MKSLTCLAVALLLSGCTVSGPLDGITAEQKPSVAEAPVSSETPENPFEETPDDIVYGHFDQDTLARVIIAEMAGQRGLNDRALEDYLALARETRDLGIIRRASRIATFTRDPVAATEMTGLWLELEPDSIEAYQTRVLQMLAMSRYGDAMESMETLLELGSPLDFRLIPNRLEGDQDAALYRDGLIADMKDLASRHPENQSARLALAQLYEQNGETSLALDLVTGLAGELDHPADIMLLEFDLLKELGRDADALRLLRDGVRRYPTDEQLRFQYGRELVQRQDFEGASEQFNAIIELSPDDYDMVYSLALINLEMNHLREAQRHLEKLVRAGHRLDDSHYYLGFIHNQYSEQDEAIEQYMQVDGGNNFLQAQRDLTELLIRKDRYPEARQRLQRLRYTAPEYNLPLITLEAGILIDQNMNDDASRLLNSSIVAYPDNLQLLFMRSVLSTNRNDLALMEQDLRRLIQLDPNDATAYNSLGYILADRTDRIDEAYELISKAYELSPDDPAIIDSLGWVQYRMGMLDEARANLEKAFQRFPDHEVAAHLGEVMWIMGDRREAIRKWQDALEETPDSKFVLDAMQRLMPASGS